MRAGRLGRSHQCCWIQKGEGRTHLRLLALVLGNIISAWPLRVRRALQVSLLIAICVLWRKLYLFYTGYPWALVPAFDTKRTLVQRLATLERFLAAPICCLEPRAVPHFAAPVSKSRRL